MAKTIVEIVEIIPAHSIFIGSEYDDLHELKAVAYLARVKYFNSEHPVLALQEVVIAVPLENYDDEIVGTSMDPYIGQSLVHLAQLYKE